MKLSTPLLATLACTQAIRIEANADSQVDAEFIDFGGIGDWASGAVDWASGAVDDIGDFAVDLGDGFMDGIDAIGDFAVDLGDGFMDGIDAIGDFALDFGNDFMAGIDAIGDGLGDFGNDFMAGIDAIGDGLGDFGNMLGDGFSDFGDILGDGFDVLGDGLDDFGGMMADGFEDALDWTVGAANTLGGAFEDAWDWVSDGDNWAALGETLGTGMLLTITGNFDQAGAVLGNDQMYSEQGRENMAREQEEAKQAYIEKVRAEKKHIAYMDLCAEKADAAVAARETNERKREKKFKDMYDTYLQSFHDQVDEAMRKSQQAYADSKAAYDEKVAPTIAAINKRKADIATYREGDNGDYKAEFPVQIPSLGVTAQMTKTKKFTYSLGRASTFVWTRIFDPTKVDPQSCEAEDCLHRDYGTPMTAHCAVCHDQIFTYKRQLSNAQVQEALKNLCGKCEMPPVADPAMPQSFPNYTAPQELLDLEADTFAEKRQKWLDQMEQQAAENAQPETQKTPEQIEFLDFCEANSPEWQAAFP